MSAKTLLAALGLSLALTVPALAVQVQECDWAASVQFIAEPWEKNTRVFSNGAVRIALIDTDGEPVCCSTRLLILAEDKTNEQGLRMCRLVGSQGTLGFNSIDFARLTANYDPARGLVLTFPYTLYIDGLRHRQGQARVFINSAKGTIIAQ